MKKCACGETNMLMRQGKKWICLPCYSKTKPVDSELEKIIEDCVEKNLIYLSSTYKKKIRKLEREKLKEGKL